MATWDEGLLKNRSKHCSYVIGVVESQCNEMVNEERKTDNRSKQMSRLNGMECILASKPRKEGSLPRTSRTNAVFPRLLFGLVVLICTEVFSGASIQVGLWHPWTWIVTYWLYFAHFFFFSTLAVRTGRTSLWSLYLWGVLFGLYESWITKVIWYCTRDDPRVSVFEPRKYLESERLKA